MITLLGICLGVLFLLVPLCVAYVYHINIAGKVLAAFGKMLLRVGVLAGVLYLLLRSSSVALAILCAILFVAYTVLAVVVKARLRARLFLVPVGTGMLLAVILTGCVLLFANFSVGSDFASRYLLPVFAILSGSIVEPVAKALSTYYMGLLHHNHLYYYMLGNGATRAEALDYLVRRALERSMAPAIKQMSGMAVGVSPVIMLIMVVCGCTALEAAAMQVLVVLAVFAASSIATLVALLIARRFVIDGYAMLRVTDNEEQQQTITPNE